MNNPYLLLFREALKQPDAHDDWDLQWSLAHRFSWAVPTERTIREIRDFSPLGIVEIGAGTGYWASLLKESGADVIAYDSNPVELGSNRYHRNEKTSEPVKSFTTVLAGGARAVVRHPERALMLCWPPHDWNANTPYAVRSMSNRALAHFKGDRLIYIGQPEGGLTGSRKFHQMLRASWVLIRKVRTPNFRGKRTSVYLFQRRPQQEGLIQI